MYKVLLVLASAAALKRPSHAALKVRGGELGLNADTAISVGTGITALSGLYGFMDPAGNLEKYGLTKADASGVNMARWSSAWLTRCPRSLPRPHRDGPRPEYSARVNTYVSVRFIVARSRRSGHRLRGAGAGGVFLAGAKIKCTWLKCR